MGNWQSIGAIALGVVVMFLAPALVWVLTIAGLVRIVRKRVAETRPDQQPAEVEQVVQSQ